MFSLRSVGGLELRLVAEGAVSRAKAMGIVG